MTLWNIFFALIVLKRFCQSAMIYNPPIITSTGRQIWDVVGGDLNEQRLNAQDWTFSQLQSPPQEIVSDCGGTIVGGLDIFTSSGYAQRTYSDLPDHTHVYYQVNTRCIDVTPADSYSIVIDDDFRVEYRPADYLDDHGIQICGQTSMKDITIPTVGKIAHSRSSLTLKIEYNMLTPGAAFSFFDISISFPIPATPAPSFTEKSLACPQNSCFDSGTFLLPHKYNDN